MTEQDAVQAARSGVIAAAEAHSARRYALGKGYRSDGAHIGEQGTAELTAALDVLVAAVKVEALRADGCCPQANGCWEEAECHVHVAVNAAEAELASARRRMEALK